MITRSLSKATSTLREGVGKTVSNLPSALRFGRQRQLPRVAMFSGYGGAGKDAAGDYLVEKYGYKRLAFSDPIANTLLERNPMIGGRSVHDIVGGMNPSTKEGIEAWAAAKKNPDFRQVMIDIGNEMKAKDPDVLMNIAKKRIQEDPKARWVVTGPRTTNEMKLAEHFPGSATIRVERPGVGPAINTKTGLPDPSETELADYPFQHRIHNTGTLQDLHSTVEKRIVRQRESSARRAARARESRSGYIDDPARLDPYNFR